MPAAAATGHSTATTRSGRCSSSAAGRATRPSASSGRCGTWCRWCWSTSGWGEAWGSPPEAASPVPKRLPSVGADLDGAFGAKGSLRGAGGRHCRGNLRWALAIALFFLLVAAPRAAAEIGEVEAVRVADRDPAVVELRARPGELGSDAAEVDGRWEVSYFDGGERVGLVVIDSASGAVRESWTGYQVDWRM